jgi:hypothetical protein
MSLTLDESVPELPGTVYYDKDVTGWLYNGVQNF